MRLFHYHLVTSQLRDVEARYVGKLGFDLVARYGRIGETLNYAFEKCEQNRRRSGAGKISEAADNHRHEAER